MASTAAFFSCRGCNYNSRSDFATAASSFLRADERGVNSHWKLHDWPTRSKTIATACSLPSKTARKAYMGQEGLRVLVFAFHPALMPHFDPVRGIRQGIMHLMGDGIAGY
eukprot:3483900-Pleurochrysis_carterae.AAC.1